jgi:hypothetical protein
VRRFGYRRLGILLESEGVRMNHKKLYRLYREETWRFAAAVAASAQRLRLPRRPAFRILVVVDDFTRECLAAVAAAINARSVTATQSRRTGRNRPPGLAPKALCICVLRTGSSRRTTPRQPAPLIYVANNFELAGETRIRTDRPAVYDEAIEFDPGSGTISASAMAHQPTRSIGLKAHRLHYSDRRTR